MRTPEDALRSVKDYAAQVLGFDWEVRIGREQGAFAKPYCSVRWAGGGTHTGPAHTTTITRPMVLYAYPDTTEMDEQSAFLAAQRVEDLFYKGIRQGVDLGRPGHIPLFDYEGVPVDEPSLARLPNDYLRVLDFTSSARDDDNDPLNHYVVVELRVTWRRVGRAVPGGRPVTSASVAPTVGGVSIQPSP